MSVSYIKPSWTRIHVQIGFHRVILCMQFCLHGLSPVLDIYGYIGHYCAQRPPGPSPQVGLEPWNVPLGRVPWGWTGLVDPQANLGQVWGALDEGWALVWAKS